MKKFFLFLFIGSFSLIATAQQKLSGTDIDDINRNAVPVATKQNVITLPVPTVPKKTPAELMTDPTNHPEWNNIVPFEKIGVEGYSTKSMLVFDCPISVNVNGQLTHPGDNGYIEVWIMQPDGSVQPQQVQILGYLSDDDWKRIFLKRGTPEKSIDGGTTLTYTRPLHLLVSKEKMVDWPEPRYFAKIGKI